MSGFVPYFGYRDAAAALEFLQQAFAFEKVTDWRGDDGTVMHGGPEETEWGTRRYRCCDPEGYEWSFGSYVPGATG